ncbi:Hypothetical predicted protein [Pelobates cultripes]|uniref:Uncharacterized protein n=1 Tax=Pelobates cultripes TaxID=61616 RepID=A0AAD1W881_PELCU|nr:Hypothetical predicted protein [Pelobates cultripes]
MAEANTFAIVKFIDEDDAPGIILLSWLATDYSTCYYPESKTDQMRERLIKDDLHLLWPEVILKKQRKPQAWTLNLTSVRKENQESNCIASWRRAPARENRKWADVLQWVADITGRLEKIEERLEAIAQIHVPIAEEDDTYIFSLLALKSLDYFQKLVDALKTSKSLKNKLVI